MNLSLSPITLFFKPHSLSKNLLFTSAIIFLITCIYLTASWGSNQVSVIQPRQLMMQWTENKQPFDIKKWRNAVKKVKAAVKSNPINAQYYFDLGRLYEWYAYQKPIWNDDAIKHRTKAIQYYKKSLEYRPTWSSAWVNLAMSKTLNMEFGDEVKAALTNAMKYGVWENGVFHQVLWLSFANWKGLPVNIQEQVKKLIKKTVDKKGQVPRYIQQLAKRFAWQEHLEEVIKSSRKS